MSYVDDTQPDETAGTPSVPLRADEAQPLDAGAAPQDGPAFGNVLEDRMRSAHDAKQEEQDTQDFLEAVGALKHPKVDEKKHEELRRSILGDMGRAIGDIPGDIATGAKAVWEAPHQAISGLFDTVHNAAHSIDAISAAAAQGAAHLMGDPARAKAIGERRAKGEEALGAIFAAPPEDAMTETGKGIRKISNFVSGFVAASKPLKALGMGAEGFAAAMAKGAFSDAFFVDPQNNPANFFDNSEYRNAVTDFLRDDKNDPEIERRLKNAVSGLGLGVAAETAFRMALVGYKAFTGLRQRMSDTAKAKLAASGVATPSPTAAAPPPTFVGLGNVLGDHVLNPSDTASGAHEFNWSRMDDHSDVREALAQMAKVTRTGEATAKTQFEAGLKAKADASTLKLAPNLNPYPNVPLKPDELHFNITRDGKPVGFVYGRLRPAADGSGTTFSIQSLNGLQGGGKNAFGPAEMRGLYDQLAVALPPGTTTIRGERVTGARGQALTPQQMAALPPAQIGLPKYKPPVSVTPPDAHAAFEALVRNRKTQPLSDVRMNAMRDMWYAAGRKVQETAQAVLKSPTLENMFAFRKMIGTQSLIAEHAMGVTRGKKPTWELPRVGTPEQQREYMQQTLDQWGGSGATQELARAVGSQPTVAKAAATVAKAAKVTGMRAASDASIQGMLWNPVTHAKNLIGNTAYLGMEALARGLAKHMPLGINAEDRVVAGEALARMGAMHQSSLDALRAGGKTMIHNTTQFGGTKTGLERNTSISDFLNRMPYVGGNPHWRAFSSMIGHAVGGGARALGAEDEIYKLLNYRGSIADQAHRAAVTAVETGKVPEDQLFSHSANLRGNPTPEMERRALEEAHRMTFTNPVDPQVTGKIIQIAQHFPLLRPMAMAFAATPSNILKRGLEYTPLAPLVASFRHAMKKGGADWQMAQARIAMGTTGMLIAGDLVNRGLATGKAPASKAEREEWARTGKTPYSIKMFGHWVPMDGLGPISTTMMLGSDWAQNANRSEWNDPDVKDASNAWTHGVLATAGSVLKQGFMGNLMDLSTALDESDNGRRDKSAGQVIGQLTSSLMPFSSVMRSINTAIDPTKRVPKTGGEEDSWGNFGQDILGQWAANTPYFKQQLPISHDMYGRAEPERTGSRWMDFMPLAPHDRKIEPADAEQERIGAYFGKPDPSLSFTTGEMAHLGLRSPDGQRVSLEDRPKLYQRYIQLAGNETKLAKYGGEGMMDTLNAIVQGDSPYSRVYQTLTDDPQGGSRSKIAFLRRVVTDYRQAAKLELVKEFPEINDMIQRHIDDRAHYHE